MVSVFGYLPMPWCTVVLQPNILIYRCGGSIGVAIWPICGQAHRFPVSLLSSRARTG